MKVFVTGHRGRIGSVITAQLEAQGHTVVGFDRADGQAAGLGQRRSQKARQDALGL